MSATEGTSARSKAATPESVIIARPDGVTDARWKWLQAFAHRVVTGHAPWCEDHQDYDDGEPGYCRMRMRSPGIAEVEMSNGTSDGNVVIGIYLEREVNTDELSPRAAALIGEDLLRAARLASFYNPASVGEVPA